MWLEEGSIFAGFKIQSVRDGDGGRTILFVKGNEGVYVTVSHEAYFDALVSPQERERVEDHLAAAIWTAYKDKASGIWSK
jgi:hypothetical protein